MKGFRHQNLRSVYEQLLQPRTRNCMYLFGFAIDDGFLDTWLPLPGHTPHCFIGSSGLNSVFPDLSLLPHTLSEHPLLTSPWQHLTLILDYLCDFFDEQLLFLIHCKLEGRDSHFLLTIESPMPNLVPGIQSLLNIYEENE